MQVSNLSPCVEALELHVLVFGISHLAIAVIFIT
jgi:hypothetical protein